MEGEKGRDMGATEKKVGSREEKVQSQFKTDRTRVVHRKSSTVRFCSGVRTTLTELFSLSSLGLDSPATVYFQTEM